MPIKQITYWWKSKKAFHKFLGIIGVFFIIGVGASFYDGANPDIDIPLIPDLTIGGKELPRIQPGPELENRAFIREIYDIFPGVHDVNLADRAYQAPTMCSLEDMVDWMADFYWNTPTLRYRPESYDCDNFARTFVVLSDLAGAEFFTGQLAIVRIYVNQKVSWGGVPAGGQHALVAFRSDKGWYVYEPQGRALVKAEKYPNRKHVWKVNGD